jgi:hypothetical protein
MQSKHVAYAAVVSVITVIIAVATNPHLFWQRFLADFWLPDNSRVGPNLMANAIQWLAVAVVMVLLYPPFRRWVKFQADHTHAKLDATIKLMEHVIKHSPRVPTDHGVEIPPPGVAKKP